MDGREKDWKEKKDVTQCKGKTERLDGGEGGEAE